VQTKAMDKENVYLYEYHKNEGILKGNRKITEKMTFQPSSTTSQTHHRLTQAIMNKHLKETKVASDDLFKIR
jgi:hypothetical protein